MFVPQVVIHWQEMKSRKCFSFCMCATELFTCDWLPLVFYKRLNQYRSQNHFMKREATLLCVEGVFTQERTKLSIIGNRRSEGKTRAATWAEELRALLAVTKPRREIWASQWKLIEQLIAGFSLLAKATEVMYGGLHTYCLCRLPSVNVTMRWICIYM